MCGIAGIVDLKEKENLAISIESMKKTIRHRGPDGHATYIDEKYGIALGHQRLSILDLQGGKQPFISENGRYSLVFNGEIYNYLALRRDLIKEHYPISSHSDTEVIIYAYEKWGLECLYHLRGMFAFALWDNKKKILFCARDRLGIKPFYFFSNQQQFIFASEIKGILASDRVGAELNDLGLSDYITFQFCLGDQTLFKNIKKLEPGYYLTVSVNENTLNIEHKQYWDIDYTAHDVITEPYYIDRLGGLLDESINLHLQADVPLGAHLSGGLDSSAVVCLASRRHKTPDSFKTFTGFFPIDSQYDESPYANQVASHVGSQHHEIALSEIDLASILPELIHFMDEPAAGPGLIPQYYVSKFAADHVKVVLGGQGGDELFIGYARYLIAYLEKCLSSAISNKTAANEITLGCIANNLSLLSNYKGMLKNFFEKKFFGDEDENYFHLIDRKNNQDEIYLDSYYKATDCFSRFKKIFNHKNESSLLNKMLYFDLKTSLPALLQVEDRMSMAVSLESRVPLLDHRLVEFSASIPDKIKFASGKTKHIFREAIKHHIPESIVKRKDKMGFPVPLSEWFYGKQHGFIQDILLSKKAKERGILNISKLKKVFKNKEPINRSIWGALCLELWFLKFIDN
ncbi:asparagine synthase (glutamine-hydrolyzing) [Rickettsiella endosymbiont of Dermanyssus gallinae]|uniref:asparagine synthase (glutamine-hydrolyzing) n=1 Tax=Rickettsiella endosymbiont of Dermanyssus gallinae TaxID=2856608 RepID=UPI001C529F7C|nr:asparagine synthase (glutamine-hydrolyzing) [Rickettsiella endosymbiont of Dermanyssus gallinae]